MSKLTELWFGDVNSLQQYIKVLGSMHDKSVVVEARSLSDKRDDGSPLLDVQNGIGIIRVSGSLLSFSNDFTRWLGITGYPDIRDALVEAAQRDDISEILLDIDSPGGSSTGIQDVSDLIEKVSAEYKPVTAFTSGTMASAAYWIGAAADKVYATRLATVGSIGVIATHFDITKQLEQEGVKATVFRAGEFKALGGPYEELTGKAKDLIQSRLDTLYAEFISHVARSRQTTPAIVREKMAEGREFLGFEALSAGLIDGVMSLDDLAAHLGSARKGSRLNTATRMETDSMAKRKILDEKTTAAIAVGADVQTALNSAPDATEETTTPETTTEAAVLESTPEAAPEANTEEATATFIQAVDDGLTTYLRTELATASEKVLQLTMENRELNNKLSVINTTHASMREIVAESVNLMAIGLGGASTDLASLSDEALLQQHLSTKEKFRSTYPVGGKSELPSTEKPAVASPASKARLAAVKSRA